MDNIPYSPSHTSENRYITYTYSPFANTEQKLGTPFAYLRSKRELANENYSGKSPFFGGQTKNFENNSENEKDDTTISKEIDLPMSEFQKKAQKFMKNIGPKFKAATTNLRTKFEELLTKAHKNDILKNHIINKRSTEPTLRFYDTDIQSIKKTDNLVNAVHAIDMSDTKERKRKHCPTCKTETYPCPTCPKKPIESKLPQSSQSQYYEVVDGNKVAYTPDGRSLEEDIPVAPRYVFDRFGHRYCENNGKLKLVGPHNSEIEETAPLLGTGYHGPSPIGPSPPNFNVLQNILHNNQEIIDSTNGDNPSQLIEHPVNLALDTLEFIKEIANKNSGKEYPSNMDYSMTYGDSEKSAYGPMYDYESVGGLAAVHQQPPNIGQRIQRSFDIIPLLQDTDDGSVLVKIKPLPTPTRVNKQVVTRPFIPRAKYDLTMPNESTVKDDKITNGNKTAKHGVDTYEVLTLANDTPLFDERTSSDEDFVFVYKTQTPNRKESVDKIKNPFSMPSSQQVATGGKPKQLNRQTGNEIKTNEADNAKLNKKFDT